MKKIILLSIMSVFVFANMHFEKNKKCSQCHAEIYKEYQSSQHAKATIFKDVIHGAVYNLHPQYNKKDKYRCGKCHTPTADNLSALVKSNNGVTPDSCNETQNEAIACAYCHRIENTVSGVAMNKNIISKDTKVYFSNKTNHGKSSFHSIKTNKKIYKNGKMCMGCHSHKSNKKEFQVCATNINNNATKKNCIECHMYKVDGKPAINSTSNRHTFHGFAGLHGDLTHLSQYIGMDIKVENNNEKFIVSIDHNVPHPSLLHPLRASKLVVTIKRGYKTIKMKTRQIVKKIGRNNKPSAPWLATQVIHNTTIPANTKKAYPYKLNLQSGDIITAKFGYLLVKPKALKKFDLQKNTEATKFRIIKKVSFIVK